MVEGSVMTMKDEKLPNQGRTACAIRSCLTARALTVEHLVSTAFERIEQLEAHVGAWEWLMDAEQVRLLARTHDGLYDKASVGPLQGIPIGVKDVIETAAIPTRMGSQIFADYVPESSARVIQQLEAAGAIIIGKTVTTEFAAQFPGKTRNPWKLTHTPGGSSSGSAAAVAAGFVPLAVGTQTRGSTIRPAAYCGVVGYKPTRGLVTTDGVFPTSNTLDHIGFFANAVEDMALLASICMQETVALDADEPPTIGLLETPYDFRATPVQQSCLTEAVSLFEEAGARVQRVTLPDEFSDALQLTNLIQRYELVQLHKSELEAWEGKVSQPFRRYIAEGRSIAANEYLNALKKREKLLTLYDDIACRYSALITHPADGEAPQGLHSTGDATFSVIWTLCEAPAIALPVCLGPTGLPLAVQLVGGRYADSKFLAIAKWCETVLKARSPGVIPPQNRSDQK